MKVLHEESRLHFPPPTGILEAFPERGTIFASRLRMELQGPQSPPASLVQDTMLGIPI